MGLAVFLGAIVLSLMVNIVAPFIQLLKLIGLTGVADTLLAHTSPTFLWIIPNPINILFNFILDIALWYVILSIVIHFLK